MRIVTGIYIQHVTLVGPQSSIVAAVLYDILNFGVVSCKNHITEPKLFVLFVRSVVDGDLHIRVRVGRVEVLEVRVGDGVVHDQGEWARCGHDLLK